MPPITNIAFTLSLTFSFTILIGQTNVDHKTTDLIKKLDADIQNAVASGDTSFLKKHLANDLAQFSTLTTTHTTKRPPFGSLSGLRSTIGENSTRSLVIVISYEN